MIADTAVFTSSPWSGDQMLVPREYYKTHGSPDQHQLDMDIAALEAEIERTTTQRDLGEMRLSSASLSSTGPVVGGTSCGTSLASSESSEDVGVDIDAESEQLFTKEDCEYLTTNLLNLLGGHSVSEANLSFPETLMTDSWDDLASMTSLPTLTEAEPDLAHYDSIPSVSAPCSPQPRRKRHSPTKAKSRASASAERPLTMERRDHLSTSKSWSSMTNAEQLTVIEDLTKIISNEMGLREQMEIIRIINPEVSISAADTEFVIDLDCLNDDKLHRVRTLVKQHTASSVLPSLLSSRSSCGAGSSSSSSGVSDCSTESSTPSQKKPAKRQSKGRPREQRQRQRKEYRQMLKEKRSGLFRQEEVLSLTTANPLEEEEEADIDILV